MLKKVVILILPWIIFIENGYCLDCFLCSGGANDQDPCSNPKQHQSSEQVKVVTCDFSNAENTWNYAKQIHSNYTGIFKITPMMFVDNKGKDMNCVTVLSRLGNTHRIFRGCALKGQDICIGVKNFENDYLKNIYCSTCGEDMCNSVESLVENYGQRIVLFLSITVLYMVVG